MVIGAWLVAFALAAWMAIRQHDLAKLLVSERDLHGLRGVRAGRRHLALAPGQLEGPVDVGLRLGPGGHHDHRRVRLAGGPSGHDGSPTAASRCPSVVLPLVRFGAVR